MPILKEAYSQLLNFKKIQKFILISQLTLKRTIEIKFYTINKKINLQILKLINEIILEHLVNTG